ncbi:hypothetical protein P364_0132000 [Paenibacillus sp. MAEPY2]|nr:hypothetical protein P364_0132000 [Paenibacillus sp. MAEPY2]KGP78681.1 hypothetical protein P363_0131920 [Paenibacillus sp. MAEPY1]OZQ62813.1 hypothetical protein CA599_25460 [Paenibacillus taichungensis]
MWFWNKKRRKAMLEKAPIIQALNTPKVYSEPPPPRKMVTDCSCSDKQQEWTFDQSLGCWYVERECERCEYYWEGPVYLYDDPNKLGNTLE